jgi:hypothetical protein
MNAIRMPPHWEHYPEHDHAENGEEELYIPLDGSGTLYADGQRYPMSQGILIRVGAATKRKVVPGPEGMSAENSEGKAKANTKDDPLRDTEHAKSDTIDAFQYFAQEVAGARFRQSFRFGLASGFV